MPDNKTRSDAWGADIPEDDQWKLYDATAGLSWMEAIEVCEQRRYSPLPSRAAWYRFLARMRKADSERRITRLAASVQEAGSIAERARISDRTFVESLKAVAADKAMSGQSDEAVRLASAAASIWDRAQKERELALKAQRQKTADETLRLAREKFEAAERRLNAAKNTLGDTKLSDEAKLAKMKEIFG